MPLLQSCNEDSQKIFWGVTVNNLSQVGTCINRPLHQAWIQYQAAHPKLRSYSMPMACCLIQKQQQNHQSSISSSQTPPYQILNRALPQHLRRMFVATLLYSPCHQPSLSLVNWIITRHVLGISVKSFFPIIFAELCAIGEYIPFVINTNVYWLKWQHHTELHCTLILIYPCFVFMSQR